MRSWIGVLALIVFGADALAAPPAGRKTSVNTPVLRDALGRFPEADADQDGVLTEDEARAYVKQTGGYNPKSGVPPTYANVAYGPHARNVLDLWKADSPTPTPLVVYIHGGGFRSGDKSSASPMDRRRCVGAGVSFASINYRFRNDVDMPEVLRDIARAIQFLRHKAGDWGLDKARVAAYGGSAGAGASLWLAFHDDLADPDSPDPVLRESSRLTAAGALAPQATYDVMQWPKILDMPENTVFPPGRYASIDPRSLIETLGEEKLAGMRRDLDMLGHMDAADPPIFLMSMGADVIPGDILHHPRHAIALKERCDQLGINVTLVLADTPPGQRTTVIDFLLPQLLKKP